MGCFDANCCLTGLPMHDEDEVRAALISHATQDGYFGRPASAWQFLTPPVRSTYNDYGSINFHHVDATDRQVLDFFLELWRPGLELDELYPRSDLKDKPKGQWSTDELWSAGCCYELRYDPGRKRRQALNAWNEAGRPDGKSKPTAWYDCKRKDNYPAYGTDQRLVTAWMCHSWAWDALYAMQQDLGPMLTEEVDAMCCTYKMAEDAAREKFGDAFTNKENPLHADAILFWFRKTSRECTGVVGKDGAFHHNLLHVLRYLPDWSAALYAEYRQIELLVRHMLMETVRTTFNMALIRKNILPLGLCGVQHEDFKYLRDWTQLVADKCHMMADRRTVMYEG